ncbi:aminoglycoside phosphotransferase family protein [Frigoribacterium sp. CFBP9039]|uniref:phosphotransferase family protein n=1 Tax=Frigoribacterium sp. CFBP9029 TaxID=3096541 RepID=UPI002A6A9BEA|nr:aminoglycoside phosphotransferase family protein [Frigoribacterium sp. CFBP9039]MDY0946468.1 aminoglycoside phosphotransferase family protein [Frigoribacterium sp. CFBP9039]
MWPNSAEILPAAFANSGVTVVSFRPHSVEPSGAGFLYGYEVDTVDALGATATVLTFIDTDARAADGSSVIATDPGTGRPLAVWAYPADPMLPALAGVTFPDRVVESLAALGIVVTSPTLTVAAYRPGKRAVIRLDSAEATLFLKVIRPDRVAPIVDLHTAFRSSGVPVPAVLASRADGLLVLERVPGEPAGRHVLALADDPRFVDQLVEIGRLTSTVPVVAPAQSDALDHGGWHRATLLGQLPRRAAEIDAVYAEIDRRRASWVGDPLTVIHGDLHLEQLFVDPAEPWRVTGVLDIDTAGVGHPARDAAALVAHLVVTGQWHRGNGDDPEARACERLADEVARVWSDRVPQWAERLAPAVASQLLAHAGGQATLGTETGRRKAVQLIAAAVGALRLPVAESDAGD